ncbi:MAG: 50S ribosomal protein L5 [Thiotrichales bacterium]|nr:MAG: 50S ribosomal protein L5 [Thiotrichales bacterium]
MPRLRELYKKTAQKVLSKQFKYKNVMQVPRLSAVTINMGLGEAAKDKKLVSSCLEALGKISGQKVIVTKARKSIAGFKIREGWPIGCKVTLRGSKMYHFMDRLINIALPRVRDFRGLNEKSFDGRGNYSFGIREHIIFPEIGYEEAENVLGMDVCITTTANTDAEGTALLKLFNFPLKG